MSENVDPYAEFADVVVPGATPVEDVDPYADVAEEVNPQGTGAFQQGAVGGAIESTGMIGGAITGATLAAPIPIPGARIAGGIIGAGLGMWGGSKARDVAADAGYTYKDLEDLPPNQRSTAVAGEVVGGSIPFMLTPVGFAFGGARTAGTTLVGRYTNQMLDFVKTNPSLYLFAESSGITGSAILGAAAEEYDPGDALTRFSGEVVGGFFNPSRITTSVVKKSINSTYSLFQKMGPEGRKTAAAAKLNDLLIARGEDPKVILELLKSYDPNVSTNVAQITGSPTLGALQSQLAKYSSKFGQESKQQAESSIELLTGMIHELRLMGNPDALQEAAKMERDLMQTLLTAQVQQADELAYTAAKNITSDTPGAKIELGRIAREALGNSLADARKAEKELWSLVPNGSATVDNLSKTFKRITDETLPEVRGQKLPPFVKAYLKRISEEGGTTTTKELTQLRTELLDSSRELTEQGSYSLARIHGQLAESVLDDLNVAFNGVPAYDTARSYSKSLNDTFTRSFAGKATSKGKFGDKIPPELLLKKATAGGAEATSIQMTELEEATRFMSTHGLSDDASSLNAMMDAQERILRLAASDSIDNQTGLVNPRRLQKFMDDHESMMERFPEVKESIQEAIDSEHVRQAMGSKLKDSLKIFDNTSEFAELLKKDPVAIAMKAITSNDPEKNLKDMIKVANNMGESGQLALRTSVIDAAMKKATTAGKDEMNFEKFAKMLFESEVTGKKSPMNVLESAGIFSKQDVKNIKKIIDQVDKIKTAQSPGTAIDDVDEGLDIIVDLIIRAGGAKAATTLAGATGKQGAGQGLIIAHGGSKAARTLLDKIPNAKVKDVLIEAMSNPKLMTELLKKSPTMDDQIKKIRFLHAYLLQSGIFTAPEAIEQNINDEVSSTPNISESALSAL